jgi:hypothetical protein
MTGIPLTQAQRDGLRERGVNDDDMSDFTPEEADEIIRNITPEQGQKLLKGDDEVSEQTKKDHGNHDEADPSTIRGFFHHIADRAKASLNGHAPSGFLQLSRAHPIDGKLVPSRFQVDDIEHIVDAALTDCEAGHNVYIESRLVRGRSADTTAVFALVINGKDWPSTNRPSMTVEICPGNFQYWLFLRDAISSERAQKLGGDPVQPYCVAGTVNRSAVDAGAD